MHKALLLAVAFTFAAGCSTSSGADTAATAPTTTIVAPDTVAPDTTPVVDTSPVVPDPTRPFDVFVPSSYTKGTAMPLVVLLHGYGATGPIQEAYFGVQALAESEGFLYVHPTGTTNSLGKAFWNATDACCGYQTTVDDVAYLTGILDSVSAQYDVDPKRIYFMGHSNGGFMSYRMACELSGRVAAIASLAGATFLDAAKCNPSEPVSVLQVHGTADGTIAYAGGATEGIGVSYPGAEQSVATWATYDGCAGAIAASGSALDLEPTVDGSESQLTAYAGCPAGVDVQLLTVTGGPHIPSVNFPDGSHPMIVAMVEFLLAHPKA
ncbi:MAG: prolyl oligopeptidase family serine peptidase [Actinobacteria bacterium]|uniref:Unannotated protein n=1 Tax=freshwater metagenome TaxID=449393 RepID=A0A6J6A3G5_9ZZZZ|nr:prolyl oligopeptidase family serine peptidase [Actinomycetota bacterium]MSW76675.1 prolyl oligopeptidase family serine peptidase [Actinomycetota bacterium]MSX54673.1 prolyl oligopeptidase family serine peptidase [Actinomycetota bacterium]MSZ82122.1 prolyl oligopeptidase family serine peptidase [Actinomycetota bacterium]MTB16961.1 prolyl oligopeptidase family serine peptidase [Actinomycetota bacterium]